jgi:pectinesterase
MYKLSSRSADSLKNRRLLSLEREEEFHSHYGRIEKDGFPEWLSAADRRLLQSSSPASQANVVVAQDGSANYRTITQAVNAAPQKSSKRYVIYVKAGIYNENVDISKTMTNLMFIGDGMDRTVVTGNKNVQDGSTTLALSSVHSRRFDR